MAAGLPVRARRLGSLGRLDRWGRRNPALAQATAALIVVSVLSGILMWRLTTTGASAGPEFAILDEAGDASPRAISPDGRSLAYIRSVNGRESLWIRELSGPGRRQIVAGDRESAFPVAAFNSDGSSLYFTRSEDYSDNHSLFRLVLASGEVVELASKIHGDLALSAYADRVAFVRSDRSTGEYHLIVADSDGKSERRLLSSRPPDQVSAPAWSPNGERIACTIGHSETGDRTKRVVEIRLADGLIRGLSQTLWATIGELEWLPSGQGLVMSGRRTTKEPSQLWRIRYPELTVERITNDTNGYRDFTISRDGRLLAASVVSFESGLWVAMADDMKRAAPLAWATGPHENVTWLPDGRIVSTSSGAGDRALWILAPDSARLGRFGVDGAWPACPAVTPDGRYAVYLSNLGGFNSILRTNLKTWATIKVTPGVATRCPSLTPDGRWVLFAEAQGGRPGIWKAPLDGGVAVQVSSLSALVPAVSPDGTRIATFRERRDRGDEHELVVSAFDGGRIERSFVPAGRFQTPIIRWDEDGLRFLYVANTDRVSNIWMQPLDGRAPVQLTNFNSDGISSFDRAADGTLLIARGSYRRRIALITNLR